MTFLYIMFCFALHGCFGGNIMNENCESISSAKIARPNFLFILLDDLGHNDLSLNGGQFPTPNMDKLNGAEGLRLNTHYIHFKCSTSRSQFLTGRYAMNMGFGWFEHWSYAEIGGIPMGQPTIANWLTQFGEYTSYAVGKWHVGYSNKALLPSKKGFDHFYGFYQGQIDYFSKEYVKHNERIGDCPIYDFFEDGKAKYDEVVMDEDDDDIDYDVTTMDLYLAKIIEYFQDSALNKQPFFMYAALQSMHEPYPDIIKRYKEKCWQIIESVEYSDSNIKSNRFKYCQLLLLTDDIIGELISNLKSLDLYENTLIIFSTDNGGSIGKGSSNYPFRGSKGQLFDGNERVLTSISGGIISKLDLFGKERNDIISNLDWTPTILEFGGYLKCIHHDDYSWDGISQYNMITDHAANHKKRKHLILNIADKDLKSFSLLIENNGNLYKYIRTTRGPIDSWVFQPNQNAWSIKQDDESGKIRVGVYYYNNDDDDDETAEKYKYSDLYNNSFLFDLTNDISELNNLLNPDLPHFNKDLNDEIIANCMDLLYQYLNKNEFWSEGIWEFKTRYDEANAFIIDDGKFVRPFLNDDQYKNEIKKIFEMESEKGIYHPSKQIALYLNPWQCPTPIDNKKLNKNDLIINMINTVTINNTFILILIITIIAAVSLLCIAIIYGANKKQNDSDKKLINKSTLYKTFTFV